MQDDAPSLPFLLREVSDTGTPILIRPQAQRRRGDRAKIFAAISGLRAVGTLPPWLSLAEVRHRCDVWLRGKGLFVYELPSRSSYYRHLVEVLDETFGTDEASGDKTRAADQ